MTDQSTTTADVNKINEFFSKKDAADQGNPLDAKLKQINDEIQQATQTPASLYLQRLKEVNLTPEEARAVIDTVCVQLRPYKASVPVFRGVVAMFQTRDMASTLEFNKIVESVKPTREATYIDEHRLHALSHSLLSYGTHTFDPATNRQATVAWLKSIPAVVFDALYAELFKFDQKISVIFSPGYLENF